MLLEREKGKMVTFDIDAWRLAHTEIRYSKHKLKGLEEELLLSIGKIDCEDIIKEIFTLETIIKDTKTVLSALSA